MLKDLNILLDLGFSELYNNEQDVIGYKFYLEDLKGFMVIDLKGDLYFGLEDKFMDIIGNISEVSVRNIQEIVPSLRYYIFKKTNEPKKFGIIDRFKGIFLMGVNV